MQYANDLGSNAPSAWQPSSLVAAVGVGLGLVVIGTALALGLGIGLHGPGTQGNGDTINLTIITAPTTTTTISGTTTTTTTTSTTTTSTTAILITVVYEGYLSTSSASYGGASQATSNYYNYFNYYNYYYDALDVTVDSSGNYTLQSSSDTNLVFYGYLYNNSFNAINTLTNLIARTDLTLGVTSQFTITYDLLFGIEYILVITTANQSATGDYTITVVGPGTTTIVRRTPVALSVVYGTISNTGVDDATNGYVQINAQDVITGVDGVSSIGFVDQVSFSFSIAPSTTTPMIFLYVMNQTSPLVFVPTITYQIPYVFITTGVTGAQNISLPFDQLPVVSGQYIGVGFSTGGGSLYAVSNRNQYYLTGVTNFTAITSATYTNATNGFAFSFRLHVVAVVFG